MDRSSVYYPEMPTSCAVRPLHVHIDSAILLSFIFGIPLIVRGIGCETGLTLRCTKLEMGGYARLREQKRG